MRYLGAILVTMLLGTSVLAADAPKSATPKPPKAIAADKPADSTDKLTLDATTVTGNKELPKVMYIVPWKRAELGQLPGQPFNSLLNDVLQPVDREVFRREVTYYEVVAGKDRGTAASGSQSTAPTDNR